MRSAGERGADARGQHVERRVAVRRGLDDGLDLGAVLVVVAERRQGHRRLAGIAVAQDHQPGGRDALGQRRVAQERDAGGQGARRARRKAP